MNILNIPVYDFSCSHSGPIKIKNVPDYILSQSPDVVNFLGFEECDFFFEIDFDYFNFFSSHNIRANFCLGLAESNPIYHNPSKNCYLFIDPFFHLSRAFRSYSINLYNSRCEPFFYKIMSLTYRPRDHRCMLLDNLSKRNLIRNNAISFNNKLPRFYRFEHWTPTHLCLPSQRFFLAADQWKIPYEWQLSFLHIVPESSIDLLYFTEKVWGPILGAKLFLVQGKSGFHKKLVEMGFVLYDEIIDYRFDSIEDDEERLVAMLDQAEQLINRNDDISIYNQIESKLRHNQLHAMKLAVTPACIDIPKSVRDYYNNRVLQIY